MTDPDPRTSPRRAARAAAERAAAAAADPERADPTVPDWVFSAAQHPRTSPVATADPEIAGPASEPIVPAPLAPEPAAPARHARRPGVRLRRALALGIAAVLVVGGAVAIMTALTAPAISETAGALATGDEPPEPALDVQVVPVPADGLPAPTISVQAAGAALCDTPEFAAALESGDDAAAIAAAGGAASFRTAVATGAAPCVPLDDPQRVWAVVNKVRPYAPIDYRPDDLAVPDAVRLLEDVSLRADAAASLTGMVGAAADAGAGELAAESAFRSYSTQQTTYSGHVADRGTEGADLVSARPGFSEHQSGLAVDVVPCDGSCATIDDLAGSPQGDWVEAHAWEHGWIVRYVEGRTDVSGYEPEPWHLRYIGTDLARAYHEGGWTTLEEFFGLPAAPDYAG